MVEEEELSSADKLPLPLDDLRKSSNSFPRRSIHRPALVRAAFHIEGIVTALRIPSLPTRLSVNVQGTRVLNVGLRVWKTILAHRFKPHIEHAV